MIYRLQTNPEDCWQANSPTTRLRAKVPGAFVYFNYGLGGNACTQAIYRILARFRATVKMKDSATFR